LILVIGFGPVCRLPGYGNHCRKNEQWEGDMTRTGLALAIVSCFPGAAFAATSSPPPSFNVKVTNPVLPVEIRNANPVPVVSETTETTLGNFNDQTVLLSTPENLRGEYPILNDAHLTGVLMQIEARGTEGSCSANLAVYESSTAFKATLINATAIAARSVISPYVPLPRLSVPAGHKLVLSVQNDTGAQCTVLFNLYRQP
jgi:hypothetical protein